MILEDKEMCQMSVLMEKDGAMQLLMKNVSELEVTEDGVRLSMLFEKAQEIKGASVKRIDFTDGKVILTREKRSRG